MRGQISVAIMSLVLSACGSGAQFGTVQLGELVVEGEVNPDYLWAQLLQLDPTFEACYVRALRGNRSAEGVLQLELSGSGGRLVPKIASNGTGSTALAECVSGAIAGLTIVEPEGYAPWDFTGKWSVTFEIVRKE